MAWGNYYSIRLSAPYAQSRAHDVFFWILKRLLADGKLKLGDNPLLLARDRNEFFVPEQYLARGSIKEQINQMKKSFPTTEAEVDMGGAGVWFFTPSCPYAAVWVQDDGELYWG